MEGIQTLKGSWPWPWIRPYGIPSCITHRPLPIYQISLKSNKLFVDGRTDGRTDGHFPPSNIIRSIFGSRPKNETERKIITLPSSFQALMSWIHSHQEAGDSLPSVVVLTPTSSCLVECRRVYLTIHKLWASFESVILSYYSKQEAQLMLTTGSTRLAVSRGQQTWYHSTCYI